MTAPTPRKNPPIAQPPVKGHRKKLSLSFTPGGGISLGFKSQSNANNSEKGKQKDVDNDLITHLQAQLFAGEDLKAVFKVRKLSKKKGSKEEYLCVTVKRNEKVRVQRVKGGHGAFLIKKTWRLEDISRMEFYEDGFDSGFALYFQDKPIFWSSMSTAQRNEFLWTVWKHCQQFLPNSPQTSIDIFELRSDTSDLKNAASESITHSYKELMSPQEEKELETLLQTIPDIDELQDKLTLQLENFEVENIHEIVEADYKVRELLEHLDEATDQLEAADRMLVFYLKELDKVKQYIENIEEQNNRMEIVMKNQKILLEEVLKLMRDLLISESAVKILLKGELDQSSSISKAVDAALALEGVFTKWKNLTPDMQAMAAVKEKMGEFSKLRDIFAVRSSNFIQDFFTKLGGQYLELRSKGGKDDRPGIFKKLSTHTEIVQWLKRMDKTNYDKLTQAYQSCFKFVYKKELKDMFAELKHCIIKDSQEVQLKESTRLIDIIKRSKNAPETKPNAKPPDRMTIDRAFQYSLEVMSKQIMSEQSFLNDFFQFPQEQSNEKFSFFLYLCNLSRPDVEKMLDGLLDGLDEELINLIDQGDKIDHFYPLSMIATVEQFKNKYNSKSSFIATLLSILENRIVSVFNKFIEEQVETIKGTQASIKKCGVLPFFVNFPTIVDYIEGKVNNSTLARGLMDSAMHKLVQTLFSWLNGLGDENNNSDDRFKFIARFEIRSRSIPVLADYIKQAQDQYNDNLHSYVELLVKAKFKTLFPFFDGLDSLIQTLPVTAIQFQQSHSKQTLLKVIEKNGQTEIERRLKKLYKQIEENVSKEEGCIPEAWEALKKYFLEKYKHFETRIAECYTNVELTVPSKKLPSIMNHLIKSKESKDS